jgi:Uma2 family endonuclease
MNEISPPPHKPHASTQAAEGLPRLQWTLAEFEWLSEQGFFGGIDRPRERLELIDGELVPMNAEGNRHERVRGIIQNVIVRQLPIGFLVFNEPGWRPGGDRYLEPEIIVCTAGSDPSTVPPADVLLLIEVADTSLKYDTGTKAKIYATLGVAEYWVINAATLETLIHTAPTPTGYAQITTHPSTATLSPLNLADLTLRLADLGLD